MSKLDLVMRTMVITSRDNKIFKLASRLKSARGRNEEKLFLIEGARSVRDAYDKGADFYCIILSENAQLQFKADCPIYTFAPKLFGEISETVTPQGIIGICRMRKCSVEDILAKNSDLVILCEALQDPGNIGTIIRTAHAAFCGGVILSKGCCDLYNPKIVRATMSGMFSVPVVQGISAKDAVETFSKNGYCAVAGALTEKCVDLYDADLKGKHLIIIGNEGNGVTKETLSMCDKVVKIPMHPDAESLNAAVAGSVMMYEHYRQNTKK